MNKLLDEYIGMLLIVLLILSLVYLCWDCQQVRLYNAAQEVRYEIR